MLLRLGAAHFTSFYEVMPQAQSTGSIPPTPLHTDPSSGRDTEQATRTVTGSLCGVPELGAKRGLSDASAIVPGYVPPIVSSNVQQNVLEHASLDVRQTVTTSAPPDLMLDVPSTDPLAGLTSAPYTVQSKVPPILPSSPAPVLCFDSPSSNVPSAGPSQVHTAVPTGVSSSIAPHGPTLAPIWSTVQSDIQSTVPSSDGVPRSHATSASPSASLSGLPTVQVVASSAVPPTISLSGPPTVATSADASSRIASEGSRNLYPVNQPSFDSLSAEPSDILWSFPQDYPPTFSSNGFTAAPSEALNDKPWGLQSSNDTDVEADGNSTMMSGETGLEASSPVHASAVDAWELADSRLSADSDAFEETEFDSELKAVGRTSEANLSIIKQEFIEVQKRAKAVAEKTGMSPAQVLQYWSTIGTRTHSKRNSWNLYSSYFRDNEEEELSRLSERKSMALGRKVRELTSFFL